MEMQDKEILLNVYSTLVGELPAISFPHKLMQRNDVGDPEMREHLQGFLGFVAQKGPQKMTATIFGTLQHIQRVKQMLNLVIHSADLPKFFLWAQEANAIYFFGEDTTVRSPKGTVLFQRGDDESDNRAGDLPFPADAHARKARTEALLLEKGFHVIASLPPVLGERETVLRSAQEVAQRVLALLVTTVRAESLLSGEGSLSVENIRQRTPLGFEFLSPAETAFFAKENPDGQESADFCWRYESLALLVWALGLSPELPFPKAICNVSELVGFLLAKDHGALVASAQLRPVQEILDVLDEHYRLHWVVRQARISKQDISNVLEAGVIFERHYALNWLVQYQGADWDDVDTPT